MQGSAASCADLPLNSARTAYPSLSAGPAELDSSPSPPRLVPIIPPSFRNSKARQPRVILGLRGAQVGVGEQAAGLIPLPWARHADAFCSAQHGRPFTGPHLLSLSADQLCQGRNPPVVAQPIQEICPEVHAQPQFPRYQARLTFWRHLLLIHAYVIDNNLFPNHGMRMG